MSAAAILYDRRIAVKSYTESSIAWATAMLDLPGKDERFAARALKTKFPGVDSGDVETRVDRGTLYLKSARKFETE